ncbi:hypothetical protein HK096_008831 [Nowakowskiella sp. JEL0078]|nr:hypothetical protein HK096_008831 [Nowakowskiella sp. JEL0078]
MVSGLSNVKNNNTIKKSSKSAHNLKSAKSVIEIKNDPPSQNLLTFSKELAFLTQENAQLKLELQETTQLLFKSSTNSNLLHSTLLSQQQSLSIALAELQRFKLKRSVKSLSENDRSTQDLVNSVLVQKSELATQKRRLLELSQLNQSQSLQLDNSKTEIETLKENCERLTLNRNEVWAQAEELKRIVKSYENKLVNEENKMQKFNVCIEIERDELKVKNNELHKKVEDLTTSKTNLLNEISKQQLIYSHKLSALEKKLKQLQLQIIEERNLRITLQKSKFQLQFENVKPTFDVEKTETLPKKIFFEEHLAKEFNKEADFSRLKLEKAIMNLDDKTGYGSQKKHLPYHLKFECNIPKPHTPNTKVDTIPANTSDLSIFWRDIHSSTFDSNEFQFHKQQRCRTRTIQFEDEKVPVDDKLKEARTNVTFLAEDTVRTNEVVERFTKQIARLESTFNSLVK